MKEEYSEDLAQNFSRALSVTLDPSSAYPGFEIEDNPLYEVPEMAALFPPRPVPPIVTAIVEPRRYPVRKRAPTPLDEQYTSPEKTLSPSPNRRHCKKQKTEHTTSPVKPSSQMEKAPGASRVTPAEKKKRNREAAARYRQRGLDRIAFLEQQVKEKEATIAELQYELSAKDALLVEANAVNEVLLQRLDEQNIIAPLPSLSSVISDPSEDLSVSSSGAIYSARFFPSPPTLFSNSSFNNTFAGINDIREDDYGLEYE